jgi:catechol 2,3-dioxygenase-like lactoylglutathione lyase family enzyme
VRALDHVQVMMPPGREDEARAFYGGLLGLDELAKPEPLAARGGCWFAVGGQELHLGVAEPFTPAAKAHPALRVDTAEELRDLAGRLSTAGHAISWDDALPGTERFYVADPFGNRLELLASAG